MRKQFAGDPGGAMSETMSDAVVFDAPVQAVPEDAGAETDRADRSATGPVSRRGAGRSPAAGRPTEQITAAPPLLPRASGTVRRVLALQQTVGNRAVSQLLGRPRVLRSQTTSIRRKLDQTAGTDTSDDTALHAAALGEFEIEGFTFKVRAGRERKDLETIIHTLMRLIKAGQKDNTDWKNDTSSIVRGVSDILGGTSFPDPAMWNEPEGLAESAADILDHAGDVKATIDRLARAVAAYERCSERWRAYQGDAGKGAGRAATGLKFTEDAAIAVDTTLLTDGLGDFVAETVGVGEEAVTGAGVAARTGEEVEGAAGAAVRATRAKAFAMTAGRAGVKAGTAGVVTMTETAAEELYKPPPKGFSWSKVLEEGAEKAAATFIGGLNEGWITSLLQKRFKVLSRELIPEGEFDKLYVESKKLLEAQGVELTRKMFMSKARKVFTNAIERLPTNLLESILEEAAKKVFGEGEAEHGDAQTDHEGREPSDASEPSEAKKPSGAKESSEATKRENERFGVEALERIAHEVKDGFKEALEDALKERSAGILKDTFVSE